ncbi:response regulator [Pricia sp. S334]|uniref:Response regulator n=1 Tax=Pricia mediterranea TaxID=3076079 RepID=A0ABU3L2X5_9FLAO|nr:response regulator [Pricia sp. S334]MDT7827985.1 response regulator [Pricia sp. S334]
MHHKDNTYDTVLIVDDDPIVNLVHQKVLGKVGIANEIRSFTDPREALPYLYTELARCGRSILVLLDINMPEMSGFEFLDSASMYQQNGNVLHVLVVSSSIAKGDMEKGLCNDLVGGYIQKPLTGPQVLDFVKKRSSLSA